MNDDRSYHQRLAMHVWASRSHQTVRHHASSETNLFGYQVDAGDVSIYVPYEHRTHENLQVATGGIWTPLPASARPMINSAADAACSWRIFREAGLTRLMSAFDDISPMFEPPAPSAARRMFQRLGLPPLPSDTGSIMTGMLDRELASVISRSNDHCSKDFEPWLGVIATGQTTCVTLEISSGHRMYMAGTSLAAYWNWHRQGIERHMSTERTMLPQPPVMTGNARLTQAMALCHRALEIDPDLTDARGTSLRPLLSRHIPELLVRHREAAATASPDDVAAIDAELEHGISRVCHAIDQGLSLVASKARDDLRTQLRFLEYRHPDEDSPDRNTVSAIIQPMEGIL